MPGLYTTGPDLSGTSHSPVTTSSLAYHQAAYAGIYRLRLPWQSTLLAALMLSEEAPGTYLAVRVLFSNLSSPYSRTVAAVKCSSHTGNRREYESVVKDFVENTMLEFKPLCFVLRVVMVSLEVVIDSGGRTSSTGSKYMPFSMAYF